MYRDARPFIPSGQMTIDLSPMALPGYAARSLLRMFIAFGASLLFTFVYGYVAAYNKRAEKMLVPLLDILQSVPVLGFLSVTVTGFMALFPGSLMGLECASIFAIFTGQAWNMTFSFYQSLRTIPQELREAATVYQLTWWQRFVKLEAPYSMIGLVWNGMMSFGGGWFFLAASEAISVLGNSFKLPGIGSYMATAVDKGDMQKQSAWAIVVDDRRCRFWWINCSGVRLWPGRRNSSSSRQIVGRNRPHLCWTLLRKSTAAPLAGTDVCSRAHRQGNRWRVCADGAALCRHRRACVNAPARGNGLQSGVLVRAAGSGDPMESGAASLLVKSEMTVKEALHVLYIWAS